MTNADRIRAMTDEELANSLFFKERLGHSCNKEECKKHGEEENGFANCEECLLDWLKQDAELIGGGGE